MTKPAQFRIGIVSVKEGRTPKGGRPFWQLRFTDPLTGKEVKRRVCGMARDKIKKMAEDLSVLAYEGKGYLTGRPKAPGIREALAETIRLTRGRPETKYNYAVRANMFVRWLADRYPAVKTWDQLRPGMVDAYTRGMEDQGRAWDSVRLNLVPVKATWKKMADNFPDLVRPLPRIKQAERPRTEVECLDLEEVEALLAWLKSNARDVWPIATLQALAGLRMQEASALRFQDVDFEARILSITDTGRHRPKTRDSFRTIPFGNEIMEALRAAVVEQKVRPASGEIFAAGQGVPWTQRALSHRMTDLLRKAAVELNNPRLKTIQCRKLRAAFATMAGRLEVPDRLLKAYLGHAPGDMLGGHYRRIGAEELRQLSDRIEERRTRLAGRGGRKDSGNIGLPATVSDSVQVTMEG